MVDRRKVLLLGCAGLLLAPLALCAQTAAPRICVLTPGLTFEPALGGLKEGLDRFGFKSDRELTFVVQDSKGASADLAEPAKKLIDAHAQLIFAVTTAHAVEAKQVAGDLPIVFVWVSDPVRAGLIPNYGNAKTNVTGVMSYAVPLSGKRMEMLKDLAPATKKVLTLVAPKEAIALESLKLAEQSAEKLRLEVLRRDVTSRDEIERALSGVSKNHVDAIYHVPSVLVSAHVDLLIKKAKEERLPMVTHEAAMAERSALLSFGPDFHHSGVQAARLAVKILKGVKPSEIPVETPDKLMLVVNRTTAKIMGAKVSGKALVDADRMVD